MIRILSISCVASGLQHKSEQLSTSTEVKEQESKTTSEKTLINKIKGPVTYIASLEGDLNQLVLSLNNSKHMKVTWHKDHEFKEDCHTWSADFNTLPCWPRLQFKANNFGRFVFGGNLFDFGDGDIRLANMMVRLYQECIQEGKCDDTDEDAGEDRIYFIMGNRDILKMRYGVKDPMVESQTAYWNKDTRPADNAAAIDWRTFQVTKTSGARESMEARRREMELLGLDDNTPVNVDDQELSDSFHWMAMDKDADIHHPNVQPMVGLFNQYIDLADLIVKIDSTIYAHGYLTNDNLLQFPNMDADNKELWKKNPSATPYPFKKAEDVTQWIKDLRDFDDDMVDEWQAVVQNGSINDSESEGLFTGRQLTNYMMASAAKGKTVVESSMYNKFLFSVDQGKNMSTDNLKKLQDASVKHVVGGHRPSGKQATHYKQGTIGFWNVRTNFDDLKDRTCEGRVSWRGGWSRLEVDSTGAKAKGAKPLMKATPTTK